MAAHDDGHDFSQSSCRRTEKHIARSMLRTTTTTPKKGTVGDRIENHISIVDLVEVVQRLLDEDDGCPWCEETSAQQIVGWLRSEIREVSLELDLSANIDNQADEQTSIEISKRLENEIGDLLFDSLLLASLCERQGLGVSLSSSANAAADKIRRRCPYVFNPHFEKVIESSLASEIWQLVKQEEKQTAPAPSPSLVEMEQSNIACEGDAVVIFTKFPIPSKCKTRLIPHVGEQVAYSLAVAMLEDAILNMSTSKELDNATKVILFTPSSALDDLRQMIVRLGLRPESFHLQPMLEPTSPTQGLTSSDLGSKLADGLERVRQLQRIAPTTARSPSSALQPPTSQPLPAPHKRLLNGSIAIMGMDCPELKSTDVAQALSQSRRAASAQLLPSSDGGYVLIVLPPAATSKVFKGVSWSAPNTCLSQINALGRCGIPSLVGDTYNDMDEYEDLIGLKHRLTNDASACPRTAQVVAQLYCPSPPPISSPADSHSGDHDESPKKETDSHVAEPEAGGGLLSHLLSSTALGATFLAAGSFVAFKQYNKFLKHV